MHLQSWVDGNFWEMKHCSGGELSTVFTQRWVAVVAFLKQRWGSEEEQQKVTWSKLIESSHVFLVFYFWRCDFSCFDGHEKLGDRDLIWYVFFMGPTWQGYIHIHRPLINPIDYLIFLYILFHFQYAKKTCVCFSFNFAYTIWRPGAETWDQWELCSQVLFGPNRYSTKKITIYPPGKKKHRFVPETWVCTISNVWPKCTWIQNDSGIIGSFNYLFIIIYYEQWNNTTIGDWEMCWIRD